MRWPFRAKAAVAAPLSLRRSFVTPEGVDLRLELGSATARASAFLLDWLLIGTVMITATIIIFSLSRGGGIAQGQQSQLLGIVWMLGLFVLRNGWFILFEMGRRGATPGKRAMRLRVIARDGARLTGAAVIARNALREIEIFLPLSFLGTQAASGAADGFLILFALLWSGIFFLFPLFNRDRLRVGDLVAGTWVVNDARASLSVDLAAKNDGPRRTFSESALALYGIYELQTLEDVLRMGRPDAIATVAATIRAKAGLADDDDDLDFLTDYYAALCARLERGMMVGRRRDDKFSGVAAR
ncbi:RDD family protein [Sphingomonas radiodurans]|uniref:RDD family protein n=1 Tax=Sphingomonas radiodurans TaxID=2890321 RepID=UPI001E63CB75|nr:RDD family protein [Sphingomonas radiodurans]WBH18160.1 RDD family protein [Sphingomonas radiodurans]